MRIFQNSAIYPAYQPQLHKLTQGCENFRQMVDTFLADRFGAPHFLLPVLERNPVAFFANGDHPESQRQWARENGLPANTPLQAILLAQIEEHRTEIFYNIDPVRYPSAFIKMLPGCVKKSVAWRAAPSPGADFGAYDLVVCNFPSILASYASRGWRTAWFSPAHDPVMDDYAKATNRPLDVVFVGGYTRHHRRRAELLEAVATLANRYAIAFHLDTSRLTRLAESLPGRLLPLFRHRRPDPIKAMAKQPVFGRNLYHVLSTAKIVLNGAIDMAGADRGNMRCFEAMGCGAALLSDVGNYPAGMIPGENLATYSTPQMAVEMIEQMLQDEVKRFSMAAAGTAMIVRDYSKARQWNQFVTLVQ